MLDPSIPSDWLILTVFVDSWASSITERNAIWWWCPITQNSNSQQTQRWVTFQTWRLNAKSKEAVWVILSEKTGQEQKIEVGVWPPPFNHIKATWKDYQRWYFQKLGGFWFEDKHFLEIRAFCGMKYLDFRPSFAEPIWINMKRKKIAPLFLKSLAYNKPIDI